VYKSLDEADHAEVSKQAFIIEGRDLIPAVWIAMTNGDAAVPLFNWSDVLFDGTRRPIMKVPPM